MRPQGFILIMALVSAAIAEGLVVLQPTFLRIFINLLNKNQKVWTVPLLMLLSVVVAYLFIYLYGAFKFLAEKHMVEKLTDKFKKQFPSEKLETVYTICKKNISQYLILPAILLKLGLVTFFLFLESPRFAILAILVLFPVVYMFARWSQKLVNLDFKLLSNFLTKMSDLDLDHSLILKQKWQLEERNQFLIFVTGSGFILIIMTWYLVRIDQSVGSIASLVMLLGLISKHCFDLVVSYREFMLAKLFTLQIERILQFQDKVENVLKIAPVGLIGIYEDGISSKEIVSERIYSLDANSDYKSIISKLKKQSHEKSIILVSNNIEAIKFCHFEWSNNKLNVAGAISG